LISNTKLFTVRDFDFRLAHLLIIGILIAAFSISMMIRSQAVDYGFELNEFDPYFNYRSTEYMIENGLSSYFDWHDDKAWYPYGRDVSGTSQLMLHITAAVSYSLFGQGMDLYSFIIIFPAVFGSLTTIIVFAMVRVIGGTTAGLFAALFFALSPAIIVRGTIGWFKSEPLGLFYGLLGAYLLLSGLTTKGNKSIAAAKIIASGVILAFGLSAWGGIQFFVIPIGLFFLGLPFLRNDHKFLLWAVPLFTILLLGVTSMFERPGTSFVLGLGGISLIVPTILMVVEIILKKLSPKNLLRNTLILIFSVIILTTILLYINTESRFFDLPSFRYLNAINPFETTTNALTDSVAEHATSTTQSSFWFHSVLMIFAGIGAWLILHAKKSNLIDARKELLFFALVFALGGVYISSAFTRLEVFASVSVILLSSIGLSALTSLLFKSGINTNSSKFKRSRTKLIKISYVTVIVFFLLTPTMIPPANWINGVKAPPTILNGGASFGIVSHDWLDTFEWMRENTPPDAVVASWWDYGYWITTIGERTSLADNGTLNSTQIAKIAAMFLSTPDDAWVQLNEMGADYVLIFVAATALDSDPPLYIMNGGGDESKKHWFMRISGQPVEDYLLPDGRSGNQHYWENTVFGQMVPFTTLTYISGSNQQSPTWQPGFTPLLQKNMKFPEDSDGPLRLAYASDSFYRDKEPIIGVFVYEVNKDYVPQSTSTILEQDGAEVGVISTNFGDMILEFRDDVAPQTVENFKALADSEFYDGTIFHRIIPGFMIQGGDPNTISGDSTTWGTGGPGYSIDPEFSDLKHTKYMVSMARSAEIDSAGSQFFIMHDDAPWLDGQYTIFGEIIDGKEIVDTIASLDTHSGDQPIDPEQAKITQIRIINSSSLLE
jgi:dolichyl-diphosphooligosaccharide--protein glycosyltransferase